MDRDSTIRPIMSSSTICPLIDARALVRSRRQYASE
jgi:hypothetical protein